MEGSGQTHSFQYITLSQVMASIEDDFHKWADAGLVDQSKYIKVIRECNEKLGIRIYDPRHSLLYVTPSPEGHTGRADLPSDFYKAEMAVALHERFVNSMLPIGPGIQQVMRPPTLDQIQSGEITNMTGPCESPPGTPCTLDATGPCSWLIKTPLTQLQVQIRDVVPLELFEGSHDHFVEYSPNRGFHRHHSHHHGYTINIQEGYIETAFHSGTILLSYLGDMRNEKGEDIIPFHPLLNEYYEWSIKYRILQNILFNTEADVSRLYQEAERQRNLAFNDAVNFVMGKAAREWSHYEHKRAQKFFHTYYRIFHPL